MLHFCWSVLQILSFEQESRRRHYRQEVIIYHEERSDLFNILSSIICSKMRNSLRSLRNPGSSCSEGSVDAGMNGVVGETSVEKPEKFTLNKDLDLCLTIFYLSWASGMTGVRGVAALFLDNIWSSIFPISFLRSLAAGSTVSQTLSNQKLALSVSTNQSSALPGVKQLCLGLTCSTETLLTLTLETENFSRH